MGGAINAAALGRLGIAVGWTDQSVHSFVRLRTYLLRLAQYSKNNFRSGQSDCGQQGSSDRRTCASQAICSLTRPDVSEPALRIACERVFELIPQIAAFAR